jgi:replication factor A1
MHYALVDDLFEYEEFVLRVEDTIHESDDLLDEHAAAMLVVQEAGRGHLTIASLDRGSSLVCFFGKVLQIFEPKEFIRDDGSPGRVIRIQVGDATGETEIVLWDERAQAAHEIGIGDVLEIVGRLRTGRRSEIHALAIRTTPCDITTRDHAAAGGSAAHNADVLTVRLLMIGDVRQFVRRDGSTGEMVEGMVGDGQGSARLVCWAPHLLDGVQPGASLMIQGARLTPGNAFREYSIGEGAIVSPAESDVEVLFTSIDSVLEGCACSVKGRIEEIEKPKSFITRKGDPSWVQNLKVLDDTGSVSVVIWGDQARTPLLAGEDVEIYNGMARKGRDGTTELHVGWGSGIRLIEHGHKEVMIEGTVIESRFGRCIDNGEVCYLLDGDIPLGAEVRVKGMLRGLRLVPIDSETLSVDREDLRKRLLNLLNE